MWGPRKSKSIDGPLEDNLSKLESSLEKVINSIESISIEGKNVEDNIGLIEDEIRNNTEQVKRIKGEIEDLNNQISQLSQTTVQPPLPANTIATPIAPPPQDTPGVAYPDGFEWIDYGGFKWYRTTGSNAPWQRYQ